MKEIRDAGRYLCVSVRIWAPWVLLQILTLVNEWTFLEELLTFGGPDLCLWERDGRGTEQLGWKVLHSRLHSSWQAPGTKTSPACSVDRDNCSISGEEKNSVLWQSAPGGFLPEALSAGGHLWQLGIVTQRLLSSCGRNRVDDWRCCRQQNDSAGQKFKGFLIPLTCGVGHEGPAEHVLMSPLLF